MAVEIFARPGAVLERSVTRKSVLRGAGVVALWGGLNAALTWFSTGGGDFGMMFPELPRRSFEEIEVFLRAFVTVSGFLGPLLWWVGISGLIFLCVRLFGGMTSYRTLLAVVGVAAAPWVLADAAVLALTGISSALGGGVVPGLLPFLLSAAAALWHLGLVALGTSVATGLGYGRAAASLGLAGFGCATAVLFLVITLVVTLVGFSGLPR